MRKNKELAPCAIITTLVALLLCAPASAIEIFVDNQGGNDRNNGLAPRSVGEGTGPCRTINRALRIANKGDHIILADTGVPYREQVSIQAGRNSGWSNDPFVINGGGAILDGTLPIPEQAWEHVGGDVFRYRPPLTSYQVLYLDDLPAARVPLTEKGLIKLEPRQWSLHDRHIYFRVDKGVLPSDYKPRCAAWKVGLTIYNVQNVVIRDLVVQGYQLDGINAHDNVFNTTLDNVTSRGNGRAGVTAAGASRLNLDECLIGDNYDTQLLVDGHCLMNVDKSEILDNTAPSWKLEGGRLYIDGERARQYKPKPPEEAQ